MIAYKSAFKLSEYQSPPSTIALTLTASNSSFPLTESIALTVMASPNLPLVDPTGAHIESGSRSQDTLGRLEARVNSDTHDGIEEPLAELSEAARTVLHSTEVTIDGIRVLYSEMLLHVERTYASFGDEALTALFERCRTDFERVADGRLSEMTDSIERLRRTVIRLEQRVEALERPTTQRAPIAPSSPPGPFFADRTNIAPSLLNPITRPLAEPIVRPFHLPPTPPRPTAQLAPPAAEPASPRINPAVFAAQAMGERPMPPSEPVPTASLWHFGPIEPGIEPLTTLLPEFRRVIDYRSYRLHDTSTIDNQATVYKGSASKIVSRMRSLMPRLANFDGRTPIALLRFLRDVRQAFDGVRLSEGAAVRTVSWFLEGDALHVYSSRAFSGVRRKDTGVSWPYIVNTLLERYLSDDILSDAFSNVTTATQAENEDESAFLSRVETYADECCGVFDEYLLVNYFLRGLHDSIRSIVSHRVHELPLNRRSNLNAIRRLAQAEGDAYRARMRHIQPIANRPPAKRTSAASSGSTLLIDEDAHSAYSAPPPQIIAPVTTLSEPSALSSPTVSAGSIEATIDATLQKRIDSFIPARLPALSAEQIAMAQSIVPKDSAAFVCWLCRLDGHTLYTCPYLTSDQRMYAAYQNYRYQLETRPHMRNLLEQKAQEHVQALKTKQTEGTAPQPTQRPRRGPSSVNSARTILRRPDSAKRSDRFPKHVLDAVMTIQRHIASSDSAPWDGLSERPEIASAASEASAGLDQPGETHHVTFAPSAQIAQREADESSTDSDNSKKE